VAILCFAAISARADGIPDDGRIIVGHGSDPSTPDSCGLDFKIHVNGSGGGIKNCINTSGVTWTGLEIFAVIPLGDTVSCITASTDSNAVFSQCSPVTMLGTFDHKEDIEFTIFGGEIASGSAGTSCTANPVPSSCFFINLNTSGSSNPNAAGGWSAFEGGNLDVRAVTPEPGTLFLLVSGACVLFRRRLLP